ncbi:MAG: hypothetical protein ABH862_07010 [Candidatus Omnitrophota bacterium]
MKKNILVVLALSIVTVCVPICRAQEVDMTRSTYNKEKGERTVDGLKFAIAEDRLIVSNGQYIEPESMDKYLGRKFNKLFNMIDAFSEAILKVEERLTSLETSVEGLSSEFKSNEVQIQTTIQEQKPQRKDGR